MHDQQTGNPRRKRCPLSHGAVSFVVMQRQSYISFLLGALALVLASTSRGATATPGANFDLSHWKMTLPIDYFGGTTGEAMEIKQPILNTYASEFFYTGTDGAMVFWCPVVGAATANATATRTELRELINGW